METIGKGPSENKEKKSNIHILFAFLFGTAAALVLGLLVGLGPLLSIGSGIGGFIAGIFIFKPLTRNKEILDFSNIDGISKESYELALAEGHQKLAELKTSADKIQDNAIQTKAKNICVLTEKILESIKKDPKDLKTARSFLNYYLDTAMKILKRYNDISGNRVKSKEAEEVLAKVERTLTTLEQAFEKQLARLMENDILDLDTELTVLERTIELEGFAKDNEKQ